MREGAANCQEFPGSALWTGRWDHSNGNMEAISDLSKNNSMSVRDKGQSGTD